MGLVTTSRKPSPRTRSFSKDLARALRFRYFTRGKANLDLLYSLLQENEILIIVKERKGNPSRIDIVDIEGNLLALLLDRAILKRELKDTSYRGYKEGEIASELREKLSLPEGIVLQRGDSIIVVDGPEFKVRKIIRRSDYFRGQGRD